MIEWFQEQRFCVIGGAGALGARLVAALLDGGALSVVVFDRQAATLKTKLPQDSLRTFDGSILDQPAVDRVIAECTVVFHLAALTHVGRSLTDPVRYLEVNCLGTGYVLDACRRLGSPKIIYTSTGHVYGIPQQLPVDEGHQTQPLSIYAASKLAGEAIVTGYVGSFGLSASIARLANVYGAPLGQETVIGRAVEQVIAGQSIQLRNLAVVRDFIYIDDVVEAVIRLAMQATKPFECRVVNVATGNGVSVLEVAQELAAVAEQAGLGRPEILAVDNPHQEKVPALILSSNHLWELTGWKPQISLAEGLTRTLVERQSSLARRT